MNLARYSAPLLLSIALSQPAILFAQSITSKANDLLYGTWVLDLSRSVFVEREAPKSQYMTFEPAADGVKATVVITDKNGIEDRISYIDKQDGKPVVLSGSSNFDEIIMTSRDPYHAVSVFTHAGMEVGRSQRTISLNGKEMMVEVERKGNLSSRTVFVKQE